MRAPESHHKTDFTGHAKTDDASEVRVAASGGKDVGDVSEQYQTKEGYWPCSYFQYSAHVATASAYKIGS